MATVRARQGYRSDGTYNDNWGSDLARGSNLTRLDRKPQWEVMRTHARPYLHLDHVPREGFNGK